MGEIHEFFVLALSLVWFAGATPESKFLSQGSHQIISHQEKNWGVLERRRFPDITGARPSIDWTTCIHWLIDFTHLALCPHKVKQ